MLPAAAFLDLCHARGVRFITGTPCSYLKPLINAAIDDGRFLFRDAVNEGDAVAMAAGATLAGKRALVMFQNSGLGNAVNALTSLCHPFQVPLPLVITHRGQPGGEADAPESFTHLVLDNEAHDSTGGQGTVSRGVALAAAAQACGYARVVSTDDPAKLAEALADPRPAGPHFIHYRIRAGVPATLPRPKVSPAEVFRRLRDWIAPS